MLITTSNAPQLNSPNGGAKELEVYPTKQEAAICELHWPAT
ncbi:unnamed protein product [Acidithrix sp. C25]|nr:unnamed protein product [Acidithrix sp. C25]